MADKEPSVLDYIKAKLMPWKGIQIEIPALKAQEVPRPKPAIDRKEPGLVGAPSWQASDLATPLTSATDIQETATQRVVSWPWRSIVALALAAIAQRSLVPPDRSMNLGIFFFVLSTGWLIWAIRRGEWKTATIPAIEKRLDALDVNAYALLTGLVLAVMAFLTLGGNLFTPINLFLWFMAIGSFVYAFWQPARQASRWLVQLGEFTHQKHWHVLISRRTVLILAMGVLVLFFRLYHLAQVPPEMTSDHAEKLLDVSDVLNGQWHIFFPRNAGREALIMYLNAFIARASGTGLSFITLKMATSLVGLLVLPYIYFLGKEVGNRRIGLWAMVFTGIAYWPNVIARVGLRFPFYPLFTATTFYYLLRGLRRARRNDFILAGISLGLSMYGYTADRILPLVVIVGICLYLVHRQSQGQRKQVIWQFVALVLVSLVIFVPMMRFIKDYPQEIAFRSLTRMGSLERQLPGPAWLIFLGNLWNAIIMFFWEGGNVWLASIPYYPALGVVSGALFFLGVIVILVRYLQQRHWLDVFLLVSIPLLMLPSILALAFPIENPNLYRTGGAIVPVFLIIGIAMDGLFRTVKSHLARPRGAQMAWGLGLLLLALASIQNFDLVFNRYYQQYRMSSWNTTELGNVIRAFADSVGNPDSAWVVPYPYWVDTRLVGIDAGYPIKDYALWPESFQETLGVPGPKLFLIKPEDQAALEALQEMYPHGWLTTYKSKVETKDFLTYFVPPEGTSGGQ